MIPKIIHLCWLSGDEYPPMIQDCLLSWKKHLPDYEVWLWDTNRFNVNSTLWTRQAFEAKKYAFVADYIRLYALYNYGGIYLDSDVIVYKSFNDLLNLPYFIGQDYTGSIEPAIIGTEKGVSWIGDILKHYENRPFILPNGKMDMTPLPVICFNRLFDTFSFNSIHQLENYVWDGKTINLFDKDFFNSRNSIGSRKTNKSYCSHNYAGAWTPSKVGLKSRLKRILPMWGLKMIYDISHKTYKKAEIHRYDPIFMQKVRNVD